MASKSKVTVNLSKAQHEALKHQARDFNFSAFIRQLLDDVGFGEEKNDDSSTV